jgi:hypothetical protein
LFEAAARDLIVIPNLTDDRPKEGLGLRNFLRRRTYRYWDTVKKHHYTTLFLFGEKKWSSVFVLL